MLILVYGYYQHKSRNYTIQTTKHERSYVREDPVPDMGRITRHRVFKKKSGKSIVLSNETNYFKGFMFPNLYKKNHRLSSSIHKYAVQEWERRSHIKIKRGYKSFGGRTLKMAMDLVENSMIPSSSYTRPTDRDMENPSKKWNTKCCNVLTCSPRAWLMFTEF